MPVLVICQNDPPNPEQNKTKGETKGTENRNLINERLETSNKRFIELLKQKQAVWGGGGGGEEENLNF